MNKDRKPRDLILCLKVPSTHRAPNISYKGDSRCMAKLARDYHEALQAKDIGTHDDSPDLPWKTHEILQEIPISQHLSAQNIESTEWLITYPQVWKALHLAKKQHGHWPRQMPVQTVKRAG